MNWAYLNVISATVILMWATWTVVVPGVIRDGIAGRLIFAVLALNSFAVLVYGLQGRVNPSAELGLNVSVAAMCTRHWLLRTYWPRVVEAWERLKR